MIKYLHLRPFCYDTKSMYTNYGISFGWRRKENTLEIAVAVTSDLDHFCKKRVHQICTGRLNKNKSWVFTDPNIVNLTDFELGEKLRKQFSDYDGHLSTDAYWAWRNTPPQERTLELM